MKNAYKTSLLTIVVLLCSTTVNAHDFEVDGIYYNITSETNLTVSVTYKGSDNSSAVYSGNITIPSSVEYNNITYSVTVIGRFAFYGCTGLTDLTIPNSVTSIGTDAFNGCKDLTNITIPESVTSIGSAAFAYCTGLTSITIPNSVTKIEYRAFERCCNLTSITIPESVTYMGGNIFDGCDNLIEFKFLSLYNEKGLLDIIGNCTSVKTLIIGKNVDNVNVSDGQAHGINSHFGNLECIIIEEGNSVYDSRDNCNALIETETNELILGCGNTLIPNTVTSIKCSAFQYKKGLNSIIIPNSVTKIDIGAFYKSSLSEVFIPSSVEFLPPVLFGGCSALKSITCESVIPPTLYDPSTDGMTQDLNVFYGVPKEECVLYVPEEAIDDYKAANIWREFVNIVSLTNEKVTSITLSEVAATLTEGDELTLVANVAPDYATDPSVVWSSNNPNVATVDENGVIKAIAPGTATVTATANDGSGVSTSCEVTVKERSILADGQTFEVDGIYYIVTSSKDLAVSVTFKGLRYDDYENEYNGAIIIPSTVSYNGNTYRVTGIKGDAFHDCSSLTSITLPKGVTSIGFDAFRDCNKLTSINIPESVTNVGVRAFGNCKNLTDVYCYAENVPSTDLTAFDDSNIENITLYVPESAIEKYKAAAPWSQFGSFIPLSEEVVEGNNVKIDGLWYELVAKAKIAKVTKYQDSEYVGDIIIPKKVTYNEVEYSVTSIGEDAFIFCSSLTSITIPNSVSSIGNGAFIGCSSLTNIIIPNSVTTIGGWAFAQCTSLTSITIPNSVTSIGQRTFEDCSNLTSVTIPNSAVTIGGDAFSGCSSLTSITVDQGNIIYDSRENCNAIIETGSNTLIAGCKSTIIPNSVTNIGDYAFYRCFSLTSINIPNSITSIGYGAFFGCSSLTCITIPNSVTRIEWATFCGCTSLTSITIPSSVITIGDDAFSGCSSLTSITIPNSATSIGKGAFSNCSSLASVTIPNSVINIENMAFYNCSSLTSISIPTSVTSIEESAFANCKNLTDVYCCSEDAPNTSLTAFDDSYIEYATLYVPESAIEKYQTTEPWSQFGSFIPLSEEVVEEKNVKIDDLWYELIAKAKIAKVTKSQDSEYVGDIIIPEKVTYNGVEYSVTGIGDGAFNGCTSLSSITCESTTPPTCSSDIFVGINTPNITLYVPQDAIDMYAKTSPWNDFNIVGIYTSLEVTLTDGELFENEKDKEADKITYTRTLNNTAWNALYVPFEIPISQLIDDYEVAYINGIHSYDDDDNGEIDRMSMEVVKVKSGTLHANHPYLIKARTEAAKQMNITVNNTTLYAAERTTLDCSSVYTKYEITGIYEQMADSELTGCYALSGGSWKQLASGSYLNPFRLYLRITSRGNSPVKVSPLAMTRIGIHVKGEESSTSFEELLLQEQPKEEIIYDLMGHRVENPVKGHIYIVNGKKRVY